MKVVIVEPGRYARIAEIDGSLRSLQKIVDGTITAAYPWKEPVGLVCNDEGLLNGMKPCRYIPGYQVIHGPFFICGLDKENFASLTEKQADRYEKLFHSPELIFNAPFGLMIERCTPEEYEDFYKALEASKNSAAQKSQRNPER